MERRRFAAPILSLCLVLGLGLGTARASTFVVDAALCDAWYPSPWDANPGDGICAMSGGGCSLDAALGEAAALPGPDVIVLSVPVACLVGPTTTVDDVSLRGPGTIGPGSSSLTNLTVAPGASLSLDGIAVGVALIVEAGGLLTLNDCDFQPFQGGLSSQGDVIIRNLVLIRGNSAASAPQEISITGGSLLIDGGFTAPPFGTLLRVSDAVATLRGVWFSQAGAEGPSGEPAVVVEAGGQLVLEGGVFQSGISTALQVNDGGSATLDGTRFQGVDGYGVRSSGGVTLRDCVFEDGRAQRNLSGFGLGGAAVRIDAGTALIERTAIRRWRSEVSPPWYLPPGSAHGGGLQVHGTASVEIRDSTIDGCQAAGRALSSGGGIACFGGSLRVERCLLSGNEVPGDGGALYIEGGSVALINTSVVGNRANEWVNSITGERFGGHAGAILARGGTLELYSCTFAGNTSTLGPAGLIADPGAVVSIADSILANGGADCEGSIQSLGYVLVQDDLGCDIQGNLTGLQSGVDPMLLPLADNGGFTLTMALDAASPALDAADPAGNRGPGGTFVTVDQRGEGRPHDGDFDGAARGDLGAFEACDDPDDSDGDGVGDACDPTPIRPPTGLLATKGAAGGIQLDWLLEPDLDSEVYEGSLSALRTGDRRAWSIACALTTPSIDLPKPADDTYWVTASRSPAYRSSLGEDSFGNPMPPPLNPCP